MSRPWILVCPSSRGIGFALTRHLLTRYPNVPILATTRAPDPNSTKQALLTHAGIDPRPLSQSHAHPDSPSHAHSRSPSQDLLSVTRCDVTDETSVAAAAHEAERLFPRDSHHLHLAFAIPGVLLNPEKSPRDIDAAASLESFRVNAVGPLLLVKYFFDFLPRMSTRYDDESPSSLPPHSAWVNMAARVGSTQQDRAGGWFSYRASKAAVISLTKSLDVLLRVRAGERALAVAYHPGTVRTELSRAWWDKVPQDRLLTPEQAAESMVDVVSRLETRQRGRCWAWDGGEVPP